MPLSLQVFSHLLGWANYPVDQCVLLWQTSIPPKIYLALPDVFSGPLEAGSIGVTSELQESLFHYQVFLHQAA